MTEQFTQNIKSLSLQDRYAFFIECHTYAREELFFRLKERSRLFYIHLLVQVVIVALAFGIQFGEFKPPSIGSKSLVAFPLVLILAVPSSFLFAALYTIEDYLVDFASRHLAFLSRAEQQMAGGSSCICNFDLSMEKKLSQTTIPLRFQAQILAFVIIPMILASFRFIRLSPSEITYWHFVEALTYIVFSVLIVVRLTKLYIYRQRPAEQLSEFIQETK